MIPLFSPSAIYTCDEQVQKQFSISEELMVEHAALALYKLICSRFPQGHVTIVCGSGNNGADGYALARLLHESHRVTIYPVKAPRTPLAILQAKRCQLLGISFTHTPTESDIIVDALLGIGFQGILDNQTQEIINHLNTLNGWKIACDIPSGLNEKGEPSPVAFHADNTVSMGGLKSLLYTDKAKGYVGHIECASLGIPHSFYQTQTEVHLLEESDICLPHRTHPSTHKGNFGHVSIIVGNHSGATILAGLAALSMGTGLVTLIGNNLIPPPSLMTSSTLPSHTTALVIGSGLGNTPLPLFCNTLPCVIDADMFSRSDILPFLERNNVVLTPHPKEFASLLKLCQLADIDTNEIQRDRFGYATLFSQHFPHLCLILKGANPLIVQGKQIFVNPLGTARLAKGGSGDVLSGIIAALLAQNYSPLNAAIHGSLAHTLAASKFKGNSFSMAPTDIIEGLRWI